MIVLAIAMAPFPSLFIDSYLNNVHLIQNAARRLTVGGSRASHFPGLESAGYFRNTR